MSPSHVSKSASKQGKKSSVAQANIMKMAQLLEQMAEDSFEEDTTGDADATSKDEVEEGKADDKIPTGMLAEIKNLYQKTDKQGRHQW